MENPMTHSELVKNLHQWLSEHHQQTQEGRRGFSVGAFLERKLLEVYDVTSKQLLRYNILEKNSSKVLFSDLTKSQAQKLVKESDELMMISYTRAKTKADL